MASLIRELYTLPTIRLTKKNQSSHPAIYRSQYDCIIANNIMHVHMLCMCSSCACRQLIISHCFLATMMEFDPRRQSLRLSGEE